MSNPILNNEQWPVKSVLTTEGAASLFITAHLSCGNRELSISKLADLLNIFYDQGVEDTTAKYVDDKYQGGKLGIGKLLNAACEAPTLLDAIAFICVWESERVVKQARKNDQWETCFKHCIKLVMEKYKQ